MRYPHSACGGTAAHVRAGVAAVAVRTPSTKAATRKTSLAATHPRRRRRFCGPWRGREAGPQTRGVVSCRNWCSPAGEVSARTRGRPALLCGRCAGVRRGPWRGRGWCLAAWHPRMPPTAATPHATHHRPSSSSASTWRLSLSCCFAKAKASCKGTLLFRTLFRSGSPGLPRQQRLSGPTALR
jgi:hypothetical protein